MSSTNRGSRREDMDYYCTPESAFQPLIHILPRSVAFWEPACGDRRLISMLRDSGRKADGNDLANGCDFLEDHTIREFIITNPPFSLAQEFVTHALETSDETMMLLRLNFLGSKKRRDWLSVNEPDAIFVLSKRPSFVNGKTDSCEYGWFYWGFRYNGIHHL